MRRPNRNRRCASLEFDPAEAMCFYALRLHEAAMIKSSPQKLIAQGTAWRFLNELKKGLKG